MQKDHITVGISLPNDKILDLSKFKAFTDDKIIVTLKLKFVFRSGENTVGKETMLFISVFSFLCKFIDKFQTLPN